MAAIGASYDRPKDEAGFALSDREVQVNRTLSTVAATSYRQA
jgi:hypothetical protein